MKKRNILIIGMSILFISILVSNNISNSIKSDTLNDDFTKNEIYNLIIDKKINLNDQKQLDIITNWYSYFDIEDMFLTKDGEYIDYTTYEIYRVHLNNQYKENNRKIANKLLKSSNYPKEENHQTYEDYINEYIKTTGKEI